MSSSLLSTHLTQIASCSSSIASLSFPQPKIFTNALLHTSDITALIRDTEAHERALFHLAPPSLPSKAADFTGSVTVAVPTARRATGYGAGVRQPKSKAVAAVLGGDLYRKTRRAEDAGVNRQGIDVEVLLEGAEKLGGVYPIPGAADKIAGLRERHQQLTANIAHYEDRVARNAQELQLMNRPSSRGGYREEDEEAGVEAVMVEGPAMTREDLRREEEEVRELERKKRGLEERVSGMERDLGGLAR
ncbi:hypothetical protein LTR42_001624 [Elasticomyces elasticus]|nr:hypothetical protein LTR42_001624 [Elasticomyces elasticus]